jgi:hypothetical protein
MDILETRRDVVYVTEEANHGSFTNTRTAPSSMFQGFYIIDGYGSVEFKFHWRRLCGALPRREMPYYTAS